VIEAHDPGDHHDGRPPLAAPSEATRALGQQAVADRLAEQQGIDASNDTVGRDLSHSDVRDRMLNPSTYDEIRELNADEASRRSRGRLREFRAV